MEFDVPENPHNVSFSNCYFKLSAFRSCYLLYQHRPIARGSATDKDRQQSMKSENNHQFSSKHRVQVESCPYGSIRIETTKVDFLQTLSV